MAADSLISSELRGRLGHFGDATPLVIEAGTVEAFRRAVGIDDGVSASRCPGTFLLNANFRRRDRRVVPLDFSASTVNAGTTWKFDCALHTGDRVAVTTGIVSATDKGRPGRRRLFVVTENRYEIEGRSAACCTQTTAHIPVGEIGSPSDKDRPVRQKREATVSHRAGPISRRQLVQWAGAVGDFNEIHYDESFARDGGLPGVVVTGSLKLAMLEALLQRKIGPNRRISALDIRHIGFDRVETTLELELRQVDDRTYEIDVLRDDGSISAQGSATITESLE